MTSERFDELVVERTVDAPRDAVWHAWTTEAGLATWWWSGWDDTIYEVDLRIGGAYRITVPSAGIGVSGEFVALSPPSTLEMTWIWLDDGGTGPIERVVVGLSDRGDQTLVRVRHTGPWTTADPAAGYRQGWNDVIDSLAHVAGSGVTDGDRGKVTGIGGVFFRSPDPDATLDWYHRHLGILPEDGFPCATMRWSGGETTVWSPFDDATDYFGDTGQEFMVNYRVDDLDALIRRLRSVGVDVSEPEQLANGAFAWAIDGDGRRFELWQPTPGE